MSLGIRRVLKNTALGLSYYSGFASLYSRLLFLNNSFAIVVNLHDTDNADKFREYMKWTAEHFEILRPDDFEDFLEGKNSLKKPGILFTFDDGFKNHYEVAAPVLEEFGARGIFFIAPGLINGIDHSKLTSEQLDRLQLTRDLFTGRGYRPLCVSEILQLKSRGHKIGYHTYSHCLLSDLTSGDYRFEFAEGKRRLDEIIEGEVDSFAWTYNYLNVDEESVKVFASEFRYCYGTVSGLSVAGDDCRFIPRTNVEVQNCKGEFYSSLLGVKSLAWSLKRRSFISRYSKWCSRI